tara:strand:- start:253 stop:381 length:129 start_codon:yes stop_codon:yes gene_type:complete
MMINKERGKVLMNIIIRYIIAILVSIIVSLWVIGFYYGEVAR